MEFAMYQTGQMVPMFGTFGEPSMLQTFPVFRTFGTPQVLQVLESFEMFQMFLDAPPPGGDPPLPAGWSWNRGNGWASCPERNGWTNAASAPVDINIWVHVPGATMPTTEEDESTDERPVPRLVGTELGSNRL